jgi:hypothetical protein
VNRSYRSPTENWHKLFLIYSTQITGSGFDLPYLIIFIGIICFCK